MNIFVICSRSLSAGAAYPDQHVKRLRATGHMVFAPWEPEHDHLNLSAEQIMANDIAGLRAADEVHVF